MTLDSNQTELIGKLRDRWAKYVERLDYRPSFVTVSGAHLYGFPSPDSDVDLRGAHQLPASQFLGLQVPNETYEVETIHDGTEVDLVSHDLGKYLRLLVKNNGYVLEQIFSPLVIQGDEFLDQLRPIATNCITRNHYFHYRGFYQTQRKLIEKSDPITAKAVLYAYRVLMTGIHLLETGTVEANLITLNQKYSIDGIEELVASKVKEKAAFEFDWNHHAKRLEQLEQQLDKAFESSTIRESPEREPVNQFLVDLRLDRLS